MSNPTHSKIDEMIKKKSAAANKITGFVRRLSGTGRRPNLKTTSDAQATAPASASTIRAVPKRYTSQISGGYIVQSTSPDKNSIEATYSIHTVPTCLISLQEINSEWGTGIVDTGAGCSLISEYEARTNYDASEIKRLDGAIPFQTGSGMVSVSEYVVADIFMPCTLDGKFTLAKLTVVLWLMSGLGIDFLLGSDFLDAQCVSLLLPQNKAVLGSCGDAEVSLAWRSYNDYCLVAGDSKRPNSRGGKGPNTLIHKSPEPATVSQNFLQMAYPLNYPLNVPYNDGVFGSAQPRQAFSGSVTFWNHGNAIPVGKAQRRAEAQSTNLKPKCNESSGNRRPNNINGHPNPLGSNPPAAVLNPVNTASVHRQPVSQSSPQTVPKTTSSGANTSLAKITAPKPVPARFSLSDKKIFRTPRTAPKPQVSQDSEQFTLPPAERPARRFIMKRGGTLRRAGVMSKLSLKYSSAKKSSASTFSDDGNDGVDTQGKSSQTSASSATEVYPAVTPGQVGDLCIPGSSVSKSSSTSSCASDSVIHTEIVVNPNTKLDPKMAAKIGCEEDIARNKF